MFTGIIEETGKLVTFTKAEGGWRLQIAAEKTLAGAELGDSIAVNGCCLTVTKFDDRHFHFDVLEETRRLTSFANLKMGSSLNLERSLSFNGKVGGHFVTGHVDECGTVDCFEQRGSDFFLRVAVSAEHLRYVALKGSVAIEGISLTVAEVDEKSLAVWIIPHTREVTNLRTVEVGGLVNLEFDLLAKYVEKLSRRGGEHA